MKILVINGSPKGENSITLQTMLYLQEVFTKYEYSYLHVGQRIKALEKDFTEAEELLKKADLLVFCYPVYTFIVPSQLHRFIELIKEKGIDLSGKYATQLSTSKHFYDITAHEFIRENCKDLGLKYIRGLSADMEDLLSKEGQHDARAFLHHAIWSVKGSNFGAQKDKRVVVVADYGMDDINLKTMIGLFLKESPFETEVINLRDFEFTCGCLGCFNCADTGKCIYTDGFDTLLRDRIQTADATIYAFKIKDHSMGSRFKTYDDRQFCNGHRTVTMGKPVGYIIDGDFDREYNLQTLIEARSQVGSNYLAGIVSGEQNSQGQIDSLVKELGYALTKHYNQPANFYGVGGMKIFRDLIYRMRGLMKEDHRFYKEHGFYDFPQKDKGTIIGMYFVGAMMNSKIAKKYAGKMTEGMLMPYKKVISKAQKKNKKAH